MNKKFRLFDFFIKSLIWISGILIFTVLISIIFFVFYRGLPSISWNFLITAPSELDGTIGILPMIINTVYIIVITLVISTPIGIFSAIYLNEYAGKNKLVKIIEFTTETLAGIPSIIYGLFGFAFFVVGLKLGYSILSGALTLTIMILPTIIRTVQEALKTVPNMYREGALGLGATKLHIIRTILVPSSIPGILTAIILSIGRIVGESAALIFTAGLGYSLPSGFFEHVKSTGATLTVQLYQYAIRGESLEIPFAIASILVIIVLIVNIATKVIAKSFNKER
ncbi:MAG: phosphate ABC transporter permease PstA [Oscillospiraceae bacterium]|nr:phosphate ABC transporter permease PstA [Oscillospiraceae bacterium]